MDFLHFTSPACRVFLFSLVFCVYLTTLGCQPSKTSDVASNTTQVSSIELPGNEWYSIYFTDPSNPASKSFRGGPDKNLAEAIRNARVTVDIAVLQLNLWSIRDALLYAHHNGVNVRVVTESEFYDKKEFQALMIAGIPIVDDRRESLMHNKFAVIDQQEVWTGSMNYSIADGYKNDNNLVRIRSSELAKNYTVEFEEMFLDDRFGTGSISNTPFPSLFVNDTRIDTCFSPDDGCSKRLVKLIQETQESINFLAFSFTSNELSDALIQKSQRGVKISGVMDETQVSTNVGSDFDKFRSAGLDVRLDGNPNYQHHKVMIIDERIVVLGSYNYTFFAETRNDENMLVIYNSKIANKFLEEFNKINLRAKTG